MIFRQEYTNRYVTKLPVAGVAKARFKTGVELLQLQSGKKKWTTGNIEPRNGLPLFVYSPETGKYWYRILRRDHDLNNYRKYIRKGELFIYFDEVWQPKIRDEVSASGMGWYPLNQYRELVLIDELLDKSKDKPDYLIKKRAIDIEKKKLTLNNKT